MRKSALLVLVFIMTLSTFSYGVDVSNDDNISDSETVDDGEKNESSEEEVKSFIVKAVHYHIIGKDSVEVDDFGTDTTVIAIPEEVTYQENTYKVISIAEKAFFQNGTLVSVTIDSGLNKIGESAFEGCSELKNVTILGSVEEMGKSLFKDCDSLKSVVFEDSLKGIDKTLFMNCVNLDSIEIKGNVELIEDSVFEGHKKLRIVKFGGNVEKIGNNTFKECVNLEKIEFAENKEVKSIGESAFEGCTSLTSITIPGSLKDIQKRTFKNCSELVDLEIVLGLEEIGDSAFEGCKSIEEIIIPATVKIIGVASFKDCTALTTVDLEDGVEEIGNNAFEGCEQLEMIIIPASTNIVNESAFKDCKELTGLTIEEGVKELGKSAFERCIALTTVIIPKTVEVIGESAFRDCERIDTLQLGEGLKEIGDSAFMGCTSLPYVVIPDSVKTIAKATFKDCERLDSVLMFEGLKEISESAFEGCVSMDSLRLPASVSIIEEAAFKHCDSLIWVKVEYMEPINIDKSVFEGIDSTAVLQVPKGTKGKYEANVEWSANFAKIIGGTYRITFVSKGNGQAIYKLGSILKESLKNDSIKNDTILIDYFKNDSIQNDSILNDSLLNETLSIRDDSVTVTFMEGDSIWVAFKSDKAYQIKDVTVNNSVITDSLFADVYKADTLKTEKPRFGQYIISYLDKDYTLAVEFERIRYSLTLVSIGGGIISFENEEVQNTTTVFKLVEGSDATVSFSPNTGWRIKSVEVDNLNITSEIPKYQYTITNIQQHTKLTALFEEIPTTQYILTVYATGLGEVSVGKRTVRESTYITYVNENSDAVLTFKPNEGYATKYLRVNGDDVTKEIANNQYTITSIRADINVNVSFAAVELSFSKDGVNYLVSSFADKKVSVTSADNVQTLEIPATVTYSDETWEVTGIKENALTECTNLAAVIWNPQAPFKAILSNPNALVYVKNEKYVAWADQNAIVDGTAKSITLTDGTKGNDFYCPKAFKAQEIYYTHNYSMETGITESKGWETIALPFDVQTINHTSASTIQPFKTWNNESEAKPFWLYELTAGGYQEAESIKANTPYLISLPNNSLYLKDYRIVGKVTFGAKDVEVKATKDLNTVRYSDHTFVPNFANKEDESILALNVNNDLVRYTSSDMGSRFVKGLRKVYPFEAYMTTTSNTRSIGVLEDMATAIKTVQSMVNENSQNIKVYDLRGVLVKSSTSKKDIKSGLKAGVYVVQGQKMIIQ